MKLKRSKVLIISVVTIAVLAMVPMFKVVVVPQWPIKVVDEAGQPVNDFEVRQHWLHYSFDGSGLNPAYGGEETLQSSSSGEIIFPERSFRASLLGIVFAKIGSPLRWINVHSSTEESAYFNCLSGSCPYESSPHYRGKTDELKKNILVVEQRNDEFEPEVSPSSSSQGTGTGVGVGLGVGGDYSTKTLENSNIERVLKSH